jgi:uncharacterized damage-inducible protein DinB
MTERERIADELRRAWDGEPWHGSPLKQNLAGVTAAVAAAHPIPGAHSIWELVLHLATWCREVRRRVRDGVARDPIDADFPAVGETTEAAWGDAVRALEGAHEEVLAAVAALADDAVDRAMPDERGQGHEVSYAVLLHGLSQHYAYHSGQIALLCRASR